MKAVEILAVSCDKDKRLDNFVLEKLEGTTRSQIKNAIDAGKVLVNGSGVKAGYKIKTDDKISARIEYKVTDIVPQDIALDIVFEDDDLAVVNKPQGMVVHPADGHYEGTLVNALLHHIKDLSGVNGEIRPGIVHRLDKDTSGLIVIAKNDRTHLNLSHQLETKVCKRFYRAVVLGKIIKDEGEVTTYLNRGTDQRKKIFVVPEGKGRLAITRYKVLERFAGFTYMEFELKTGRTHQIRVHAAHIGHPVLGDMLYGTKDTKFGLMGQLLHAYKLEFVHPTTKKAMSFVAPLPEYFEEVLNKLKKTLDL
ncbi:MAG: RluA family pseudouridine synthase [Christensenellaceae bacterium]|jgi:23S rRNA pseudouridine1911/1915/1917 synthase|nr:RluA family pseudouridine synthase [Christensenellaceae bacterium]